MKNIAWAGLISNSYAMEVLNKTMTDLRFVRVFIVHNWFSLWVSTYTGFEVSLQGLVSKTEKDDKKTRNCKKSIWKFDQHISYKKMNMTLQIDEQPRNHNRWLRERVRVWEIQQETEQSIQTSRRQVQIDKVMLMVHLATLWRR